MNRSTTLILGALALTGLSTGCSGRVGAPNTPALVTSQAAFQQDNTLATASNPARSSYTSLYSFKGGTTDGISPSGLVALNGALYGTANGGTNNFGMVFEVNTSGAERVLYNFTGGTDGRYPQAGLIAVNGTLYSTTSGGGTWGSGTVFEISTSGTERVLYSFLGPPDGSAPFAGLTTVNSTLYGTTIRGGAITPISPEGRGVIFEVNTSGSERVLYSDAGGSQASLVAMNGTLYGTTPGGGTNYDGTIFALSPSGIERTLYNFKGGTDATLPTSASLIVVNGALYGTTPTGGTNNQGAIFEVCMSGEERVLYSFKGGTDGRFPTAGLIAVNGTLYGTTVIGGTNDNGTIFELSSSGTERVLYRFKGGTDGAYPTSGSLTVLNGALYGTTSSGGTYGNGTVFKLSL